LSTSRAGCANINVWVIVFLWRKIRRSGLNVVDTTASDKPVNCERNNCSWLLFDWAGRSVISGTCSNRHQRVERIFRSTPQPAKLSCGRNGRRGESFCGVRSSWSSAGGCCDATRINRPGQLAQASFGVALGCPCRRWDPRCLHHVCIPPL